MEEEAESGREAGNWPEDTVPVRAPMTAGGAEGEKPVQGAEARALALARAEGCKATVSAVLIREPEAGRAKAPKPFWMRTVLERDVGRRST